ncbi:hypothetical protein HQ602_18515 [Rhodococcus kroppenstedtii]|uniref:hypothetical protein n=1 Tax=Rhodococcoides kroppenstedtii TaxID=293050 RepID=UPI001C9B5489|nr:hypothetical protein [Rhodococcus kroppenstedtii]MBY6438370.1 hypothetical protein [Rhodococcus kroppenstedtii]
MTKPLEPWSAALVLVAAVAVTAASVVGVASPVLAGPVIGSTVAIVVGQALVVALVLGSRRSRPDLGLAATAAVGAVALGLAVTDLQLFARALDADRLDLFRPTAAAAPSPTFGSVALLAGHAAYVVAGVLAAVALARRPSVAVDDAPRRGVLVLLGAAGAAAAVVSPAYVSTDSVFLAPSVLGAPLSLALGYVLAALAVLVVVALAATSPRRDVTRGALVGVALSVLLVVVPRVPAAATAGDRIDVGPGTWLGLVGAALLLAAARPDRTAARPNRTDAAGERRRAAERPRRAPNARLVAGSLLLLSAAAAGAGSVLPVLAASGPIPRIAGLGAVAVSGVVVATVGVLLCLSEFAPSVRPASAPILAAHVALVAVVLQAVVLGVGVDGVRPGLGGWLLGLSVLAAVVAAPALAAAGGSDPVDSDAAERPLLVRAVAWTSAVLIVVGSLLPARSVDGRLGGWIGTWPWGWDVWGRVVFAAVVVTTAAILLRARRSRAVAAAVGTTVGAGGLALAAIVDGAAVGAAITGVGAIVSALLSGLLTRTDE